MANLVIKDLSTIVKFALGDGKEVTVSYYTDKDKIGLLVEGYPNINIAPIDESSVFVESVE